MKDWAILELRGSSVAKGVCVWWGGNATSTEDALIAHPILDYHKAEGPQVEPTHLIMLSINIVDDSRLLIYSFRVD